MRNSYETYMHSRSNNAVTKLTGKISKSSTTHKKPSNKIATYDGQPTL